MSESDPSGLPAPAPIRVAPPVWWNRLGFRITAVTVGATIAAIGAFVALAVRAQQTRLEGEAIRGATLFSDTIRSSTHDQMLRDDKEEAYRVMERIGGLRDVERVRLFNSDGRVTFSTDHTETGQVLDRASESCTGCHTGGAPKVELAGPRRSVIVTAPDGHRRLTMVTPIYNEPACSRSGCHVHQESRRVLGGIGIDMSLAAIDGEIVALRNSVLAVAFVVLVVLSATMAFSARRFFGRPVRELLAATARVARGDLKQPVPVRNPDELGQLAESFNRMRESLSRARADLAALMNDLERQVEERTADLRNAQQRLIQGEKLASLGKLSASIAHEINNPLAGILTSTKLVLRTLDGIAANPEVAKESRRQLELVQRETERCSGIVRNLLDFSRQRPVNLADVNLNGVVDESLSLVGHQIQLQGIRLVKDLHDVPVIRGDFGQLRQAVVNIVLNACDAMPRGGTLKVSTAEPPDAAAAELVLEDTGTGIAPEALPRIFDPFFTTKEKGTGLGLSVVYGIVERFHGTLSVQSKIGVGTTFRIRFPAAAAAMAPRE